MAKKPKIAVIGGGMGSLSTVWHLTRNPKWREHYEITVYQLGWRLGGKGASGVNTEDHMRNEEHGLHLMFGFYHNALPLLQELYTELGRPPGSALARFEDAFVGYDTITLLDRNRGPNDQPWVFEFPRRGAVDPMDSPAEFCIELLEAMAGTLAETKPGSRRSTTLARLAGAFADGLEDTTISIAIRAALEAGRRLVDNSILDAGIKAAFAATAKGVQAAVHRALEGEEDTDRRHAMILLDLAATVIVGMTVDFPEIRRPDWFSIDDTSFEQWLRQHGAKADTYFSPPVRMLKDVAFSQSVGMGAGTTLHYALRMVLSYTGSFYYRMSAGMGDTVFAPMYRVLQRRGVRFAFFHRVDDMQHDARGISTINIGRQVIPTGEYDPLMDLEGLEVWPTHPLYAQLRHGAELQASGADLENAWNIWPDADRIQLRRGRDFDYVVLGASLGALPAMLANQLKDPELTALRRMVATVRTTDILSAQLWIERPLDALGWATEKPLVGGINEPLDTWADMSQLLTREAWPKSVEVCSYHCGGFEDDGEAPAPTQGSGEAPIGGDWWERQMSRGRDALGLYLQKQCGTLFPGVATPEGGIDLDCLCGPADTAGAARIDHQYWHTTRNPSDRYVQSVPGSVHARLAPWQSGIDNLLLTGDWVLNSYSAGCLEATVISGMMCAQALIGEPYTIKNDWLPLPRPEPLLGRPPAPFLYLDGSGVPAAPYTAEDADLAVFLLRADRDRLQAICDQRLNLPGSPWVYRPLVPYVMHVCADLPRIATAHPLFWAEERDFGFWMPVAAGKMHGDDFVPDRFAFFIPYLWVDVGMAVSAGREIFGYGKSHGKLSVGDPERPELRFSIDTQVVERWGGMGRNQSKLQWRRVVEVTGPEQAEMESLSTAESAVRAMLGAIAAAMLAEGEAVDLKLAESVLGMDGISIPLVFFKQFPSITAGGTACYSAVVEAPNPITRGPAISLLRGDWAVRFWSFASLNMVDQLGIKVDAQGVIPATLALRARFDFRCDPGRVIFSR